MPYRFLSSAMLLGIAVLVFAAPAEAQLRQIRTATAERVVDFPLTESGGCTDISQLSTNSAIGLSIGFNDAVGQSFTATCDGDIHSISFDVNFVGVGGLVTMAVHEGAGDGGPVLGTGTVDVSSTGMHTVSFSPAIPVSNGQVYTFKMTVPEGVTIDLSESSLNPYAGGTEYNVAFGGGGTTFGSDPNYDLVFVVDLEGGGPTCPLDFAATINGSTFNQGDQIVFNVTVTNTSASTVLAALRLVATGPANQTVNFGQANVPAGVTANRTFNVRIPQAAPNGTYSLVLDLDANGADCDTEEFTISVTAPRMGATGSTAFELVDGTLASSSAVSGVVGVAPNPFVNQAAISFEVAEAAPVRLAVYDVLGREVAVLVDAQVEAGAHTATFDARGLAAGTYVYRLVIGADVQTGRMTLAH